MGFTDTLPAVSDTQARVVTSFEASTGVTAARHCPTHAWLMVVLLVTLFQGIVYLVLLPPWQHYDEPTHFEYAWLIANRAHLPTRDDFDPMMRREVAASMLEHHFFWNLPKPDIFGTSLGPTIGLSELTHPPIYYLLVSLPLRFARHLDVTSQLYIARCVSLLIFVLTSGIIAGAVRDLAGAEHPLRWAIPIIASCIPPIADIMTAVNNDVGAVFIFSLFLWGVIRLLYLGFTWRRTGWIVGSALAAVFVKDTAASAILLLPLICLLSIAHHLRWSQWRSVASLFVLLLVAFFVVFQGGDAADWYRWSGGANQSFGTRTVVNEKHVVTIEALPDTPSRYLLNPILSANVSHIAGRTVTIGGWIWATEPTIAQAPGLVISNIGTTDLTLLTHPIMITTTPTFTAWTTKLTPSAGKVYVAFSGNLPGGKKPIQLFLRNPILIEGVAPSSDAPLFSDADATRGSWGQQSFVNVVRNAGTQRGWPRLRPEFDRLFSRALHQSPAQILDALFDISYTWPYLVGTVGPALYSEFFSNFAWGHVRLQSPIWEIAARIISILAVCGCLKWVIRNRTAPLPSRGSALLVLAVAGVLVWLLALLWPLPYRWSRVLVPSARYTFPALLPTVLVVVGGWQALWPRRLRSLALYLLLLAVVVLDAAAVATIWSFYHSLPIT
ncbi:MAG: hypothetical protein H0X37_07785 [Herpetosiphonaceae bacterium]|nr:hypothetical protein [Herpetosiphonaceae bacterium]